MSNRSKHLFAYLVLFMVTFACANPPGGTPPESPANIETVVAATLQALTQVPPPPNGTSSLLPHPLYFLNNDGAGLAQVYRLDKDGVAVTQLTFEPANVDDYDVSMMDGSVAYVSNNQLFTINADGGNRSMIFNEGAVSNPVWSPNGGTIAFAYKGLNFYSIASGQSNRVLEDQVDDLGDGLTFPRELYWPASYSADGSKLVITLGYYESASTAIYYPNGGALVRLNGAEGAMICCGDYHLTSDASTLYAASPISGMFNAGLWRVNTSTGDVTTLLLGSYDTNPAEVADNPFLAPDGQLYFFYASLPNAGGFIDHPPLQLVRSAADGVTGRTILRPETFENMNEAIWAPDASFVIIANPALPEIYQGGAAQLYYTDGQKAMVSLIPYAMKMKWGP